MQTGTGNSRLIWTLQVTGKGGKKRVIVRTSDQVARQEKMKTFFPEHHLNEVDRLYKLYIMTPSAPRTIESPSSIISLNRSPT